MEQAMTPMPGCPFESLPPELYDKIWSMTCKPRTISIYLHEGLTPDDPMHLSATLPPTRNCRLKPACIVFTAELGAEAPKVRLDRISKNNARFRLPFGYFTIPWEMRTKPPPGPISLQVSHRSRESAKRQFQPSFAGINLLQGRGGAAFEQLWAREQLGEKRIWINFREDIVYLHNADGQSTLLGNQTGYTWNLPLIAHHAKEELQKIRNLAISGVWSDLSHPTRNWGNPPNPNILPPCPWGDLRHILRTTLKEFKNLQRLLVHNTDYNRLYMRRQWQDVAARDLSRIREEIIACTKQINRDEVNWPSSGPTIKILKGYEASISTPERFEPPNRNNTQLPSIEGPPSEDYYVAQHTWAPQLQGLGMAGNPPGNHALQDYQMQLLLLEQQNRKRRIVAEGEESWWIGRELEALCGS